MWTTYLSLVVIHIVFANLLPNSTLFSHSKTLDLSIISLGSKHTETSTGLYLSQSKYICDLLDRFHMSDASPCHTLMAAHKSLSAFSGELLPNPIEYRSAVGALQYLCNTRLDISYSVGKLSQYLSQPTIEHWKAIKRVLKYLRGTIHYGIHIKPSAPLVLAAYSDADWASCPDDRRSVGGYCVFLGDSLVSWSSKKQLVVSRSSCEC
ncbi:hypothetical protein QN277_019454 [Acacia crassicarpa]|uniref:Uncharacterized protein n=1 Tax=Acacia crassicarpa TaxID=499986 RepID=A0AAE1JKT0_9FABA|nr:hypothetical protein QN277_019454 [Acacia crassicarpa]